METATGIVHSSLDSLDGLQAEDVGLTDDNLKDEFVGFLNIQNEQGIGCCEKSGDYWVILASSTDEIPIIGLRTGFLAALSGILTEFLFFAFMLIGDNKYFHLQAEEEKDCLTEGKQETSKAEHHVLRFVNLAAIFVSGLVTFFTFAGRVLFQNNTVGYYIFVYPWSKGLNIFTINRILIYICVIIFVMSILLKLLSLLASLLPSRQETVVRLLLSFVKYSGVIGAVYFCMTLLGVPTSSLLASAGALTVIFSIGAQSIVADILAGLFIIFEGSFKVGDMITVEDWHGQVVEIGIRNTRIRDLISSDVKIMNNSTIKKVINYSTTPSFCHVTIGIEYGFDLEEIDAIIEKEKPVIKKNMPLMLGDIVYLGVDEFADSAVILKFQAACRNQDDLKVRRALNRELKLMFDRNGINVPFPQIVLNERE